MFKSTCGDDAEVAPGSMESMTSIDLITFVSSFPLLCHSMVCVFIMWDEFSVGVASF